MALNRRRVPLRTLNNAPTLLQQLENIREKAQESKKSFARALNEFSYLICKIYNGYFSGPGNKSRAITDIEKEKIRELLDIFSDIAQTNSCRSSSVDLLEARYAGRCRDVEAALSLCRDIHKKYPRYQAAYDYHSNLLKSINRLEGAERVQLLKEINCRKKIPKEKMAPGFGRVISLNKSGLFNNPADCEEQERAAEIVAAVLC